MAFVIAYELRSAPDRGLEDELNRIKAIKVCKSVWRYLERDTTDPHEMLRRLLPFINMHEDLLWIVNTLGEGAIHNPLESYEIACRESGH
jgi:hypothetical protein